MGIQIVFRLIPLLSNWYAKMSINALCFKDALIFVANKAQYFFVTLSYSDNLSCCPEVVLRCFAVCWRSPLLCRHFCGSHANSFSYMHIVF